ncbi:MAG: cation efflux system protein CusF [Candidatus Desulfovibrio kirbyi]|uniref:Cation efflux system protein CusF n=1 Tax=Candidatus Desulfovibrio kirbyi TaxID=2696086 RepID=A0A6L2R6N4_9BACT|nr:MAG: cation efflux system protein CusF [Candidatus Desulfovibrio kirbyi]
MKSAILFVLSVSLTFFSTLAVSADHAGHGGHSAVPCAAKQQGDQIVATTGIVESVDRAGGKVTITHDPIPSLNWPKMIMRFTAQADLLEDIKAGDKVRFDFRNQGSESVLLDIERIQ